MDNVAVILEILASLVEGELSQKEGCSEEA